LPKFIGFYNPDKEKSEKTEKPQDPFSEIPKEISVMQTIKSYLQNELLTANIVYERIYPNSLPVIQRKSLFFTELYAIKPHYQNDAYLGKVLTEKEFQPYFRKDEENTLIFESRFECGNLRLAIKKSDTEYDLYLQNDINTRGNIQWFYFRVANTKKGATIFFNLKNFVFFII